MKSAKKHIPLEISNPITKTMLNAMPMGVLLVDKTGQIVFANKQIIVSFGYSEDELLGERIEILVPERFRSKHPTYRNEFFHVPEVRAMGAGRDLYGLRKDGSEFPVEIGLNPLTFDKEILVIATIVDITNRKQQEARFQRAIESAPNAMVMINGSGEIVLANQMTENLFGYDRSELINQKVEILVPERFRAKHPGHRGSFFTNPETRAMGVGRDLYGVRKNGVEVPVEIGLNPITTEEGTFVLASIVDITERKKAQERFQRLIESAPNVLIMVDKEGKIQLVNNATEKLFGYAREELLHKKVEELVPERFRGDHAGHRTKFYQNPQMRAMGAGRDLYGLKKDGTEVPIEIGLNPIGTEEGMYILASIVDITERKRIMQTVSELAAIVESSDDAIVGKNLNGLITSWNRGAERLYGYSANEAIGKSISMLVPHGHEDEFPQILKWLRNGEHIDQYETLRRRKNGENFYAAITISPIINTANQVTGASVTTRDITERKRAEERFKQVVESAPNAMIMVDQAGKIQLINKMTEQLFGYTREELLGKKVEVLVPIRFRHGHPSYREEFYHDPKTRAMGAGRDLYGVKKDGTEVPIEIGLNPLETAEGVFVLASIVDITERKQAQDLLLEQKRNLEKVNLELDSFVYTASHDLRAPLRGISSYASILEEDYKENLNEEGKKFISKIKKGAEHLSQLIDDLLSLSRISRIHNPFEPVDITELIKSIQERIEFDVKGMGVEIHIPKDMPYVSCDRIKMSEVFLNLINNAIKFSSKTNRHPVIDIGYNDKKEYHEFFVKDNGIGIEPEYHEKIFEIFKKLNKESEYEGTGVGLSIVKRIIDDHNGKVWVESSLGKGACFYFTIPKNLQDKNKLRELLLKGKADLPKSYETEKKENKP